MPEPIPTFDQHVKDAIAFVLDATNHGVDSERGQFLVRMAGHAVDAAERAINDSAAEYEIVTHMRAMVHALRTPEN